MSFDNLFGNTLKTKSGEVETSSALNGKTVGLYFSAHWCPPCRGFTPKLADFYNKHKDTKNFEVVFVSGDNDTEEFEEYYNEMPWLAVSYGSEHIDKLNEKYEVKGIPSLVILDSQGEIITRKGRQQVMADPDAKSFPWIPKTYSEIIGGPLIKTSSDLSQTIPYSDLKGKLIGIYFSAHWCPPCRNFTPVLADFYKKNKENKNFEIIFSSRDKDEKSYKEYYSEMPWLSLPFPEQRNSELADLFEFEGIPHLVFVDYEGKIVCSDATDRLREDPEGTDFPWPAKLLYPFTEGNLRRHLLSSPLLLVKSSDEQIQEIFPKLSKLLEGLSLTKEIHVLLFTETNLKDSPGLQRVFQLAGVEDNHQLVLLNVPQRGKFVSTENARLETIQKVLSDFGSGSLEFASL